jgi:hypothetical protein
MGRGRHSYIKVKVVCACGWKGKRSTLAQSGYIRREQGRGTFVARRKFDEGRLEL